MASTLGHALCGLTVLAWAAPRIDVASVWRREVPLFVVLANLPDIDMLAGWLWTGDVFAFHGGLTHGMAFALLAAMAFAVLLPGTGTRPWRTAVYFLAILSHDLVDMLTGSAPGMNPTRGVEFWSPFSDRAVSSPVTLFLGPHHDSWARLFSPHNLKVMGLEALCFTPLLLVAYGMRGREAKGGHPSTKESR